MAEFVGDMALIPLLITLATGFVAIIGHSWSPFISLQGRLGATVIYGVLIPYPLILILLMVAERFQVNRTRGTKSHDLFEYWKDNGR